ncbi:MAG: PAC2 family protein, partial [Nanoarchaeota archaeon]
ASSDTGANTFYYSTKKGQTFEKMGLKPLKEGIVMGVTGALMLKAEEIPLSCIFVETQSNLPDSRAAAKIIEALDKYLGLDIDYKPLLKAAEKFEEKVKGILESGKQAMSEKESKELNYLG